MDLKQKTVYFIQRIKKSYLVDHDFNFILSHISSDATFIGIGHDNFFMTYEDIAKYLYEKHRSFYTAYSITEDSLHIETCSDTLSAAFGKCSITRASVSKDSDSCPIEIRYSMICRLYGETLKCIHMHFSIPDKTHMLLPHYDANMSESILKTLIAEKTIDLHQTKQEYEMLLHNIPGGVYCCYEDTLQFSFFSQGYLNLIGFTKEDIKTRFHNSPLEIIFQSDRKQYESEIKSQLAKKGCFKMQYRILNAKGNIIWVYELNRLVKNTDGSLRTYSVLIDITSTKAAQEALRLSEERHRIIMDQSTEIIFEWNIKEDTLYCSHNFTKKFGYTAPTKNIKSQLLLSSNIHPHDLKTLAHLIEQKLKGCPYSEADIRFRTINGKFLWCLIRATTIFDSNGKPEKAVGVIIDIDAQKKEKQALLFQAQRDSLTGLYNKITTQAMIEKELNESSLNACHALFMVDIDNFKSVNDSLGHLFGDAVLTDISASISQLFCDNDIIGRVGGDEFIVFLKNIPYCHVPEKAAMITEVFRRCYTGIEKNYHISGSVGVSLFPKHGKEFSQLYQNADTALYQAKNQGKNCFQIFDVSMKQGHYMKQWDTTENPIYHKTFQENIFTYIFEILYEEKDLIAGIHIILGLVGKQFCVSRVYIFEYMVNKNASLKNTFEWCDEGITCQIDQPQDFTKKIQKSKNYFNGNDVFYCNTGDLTDDFTKQIMKEQGIYALLQCPILENGQLRGLIGFDECKKQRIWTKEEMHTMSLISKIVGLYLNKFRRAQYEKENTRLTCPTFRSLKDFCSEAFILLQNKKNEPYLLLYGNIEKFKYINDTLGYEEGDRVLGYLYECINKWLEKNEIAVHVALDRFVILICYKGEERLEKRLRELKSLLDALTRKKTAHHHIKILWGAYLIKDHNEGILSMIDKGALAAKEAKNVYGRNYCFYTEKMNAVLTQEKEMENIMEQALKNNEFILCLQPQIELSTKKTAGAEVLVRWEKTPHQYNYPDHFIPLFEKNGFVLDLDYYVFEEACKLLRRWITEKKPVIPLAVNFSALHIQEPDFLDTVKNIVKKYELPPYLLDLELTEQSFAGPIENANKVITQLKEYGFILSIDDFGTGYSSFNSLKSLPVDTIKLDKSFFSGEHPTKKDKILISGMTDISHKLGLKVIAEGVETKEQCIFLESINCDYIQGYYMERPLPIAQFELYMKNQS